MIYNKEKVIYISLVVFTFFLLDKCTVVDLSLTAIFKSEKLKSYHLLTDVAPTSTHEIVRLDDDYKSNITYDTINNYFLRDQLKFNAQGQLINSELKDKIISRYAKSHEFFSPEQSHYVFNNTFNTVYDLSKSKIKQNVSQKIVECSDENPLMNAALYKKAAVVIYSGKIYDYYKIYLKIDNEWKIIIHSGSYPGKRYPEKYRKLIFLKDLENKRYSCTGSEDISNIGRHFDELDVVDETIEKPYVSITKELYTKDETLDRFNLIEDIITISLGPKSFYGTQYSKLKKGDDFFYFKTGIDKHIFSGKLWAKLSFFSVPERFKDNTDVNFIVYKPTWPENKINDEGTYIVRPKQ